VLATPVAALLPLTATNMADNENACAPLLKQMQQAPAPAPAQKKKKTPAKA